jgi:thymidylate kinase
MIILLEGLNCTGKSTLAKAFSERLEIPVVKFNVPGTDPYQEFSERLQTAVAEHRHFIVDRLHLSNYAYNGWLGGGVLNPQEWGKIDQFLSEQTAVLYWMVDTPHAIEQRLTERQDRNDGAERLDRSWLATIHDRFQEAFRRSMIPNKGSFMLTQFILNDQPMQQLDKNLQLLRALIAGIAY